MEIATFTAWQIARMTQYGGKTLKPLGDWLKQLQPRSKPRRQSAEEMLQAMRAVKAASIH